MSFNHHRNTARKKTAIAIEVDERVTSKLEEMGKKFGFTATGCAMILFETAYAARFGKDGSGDRELDAMVAATLILHGSGIDFTIIAKTLGTDEETVERIVGAWLARNSEAVE